jgi:hypothetical protein
LPVEAEIDGKTRISLYEPVCVRSHTTVGKLDESSPAVFRKSEESDLAGRPVRAGSCE